MTSVRRGKGLGFEEEEGGGNARGELRSSFNVSTGVSYFVHSFACIFIWTKSKMTAAADIK